LFLGVKVADQKKAEKNLGNDIFHGADFNAKETYILSIAFYIQ
jgi:hypothetical protein